MSKIKFIIPLMFLQILSVNSAIGQVKYLDTLRVQMPNETTIEYAMDYRREKRYKPYSIRLQEIERFKQDLKAFVTRWEALNIEKLEEKEPLLIQNLDEEIKISKRESLRSIYFLEGSKRVLQIKGKHKAELTTYSSKTSIYFDNTEQLKELLEYNFDTLFAKIDKSLKPFASDKNFKRDILKVWFSIDENLTVRFLNQTSAGRKNPFLSSFNIGISPNIRNMNGYWSAGFLIGVNYFFNWQQVGLNLGYETSYMFTKALKSEQYQWVNLSLFTFDKKTFNGGFSFGYLINEKKVTFNKNNFRIGLLIRVNNVTVSPEFYFKDFFKSTKKEDRYFAVKIALGL